jgi:hypothetical protein
LLLLSQKTCKFVVVEPENVQILPKKSWHRSDFFYLRNSAVFHSRAKVDPKSWRRIKHYLNTLWIYHLKIFCQFQNLFSSNNNHFTRNYL